MHYTLDELLEVKVDTLGFSFYKESDFNRILKEGDKDPYRLPFWRDCQRLISAPSYRRLKGKTQLFPGHESDFFRCRLTHSQEVAHIGKTIAKRINIILKEKFQEKQKNDKSFTIHPYFSFVDVDLVEFACLAHDLGHPPFGHQGEEELNELMKEYGGFEGNAQTLRLLTRIEKKSFDTEKTDNATGVGFTLKGKDARLGINPTFRSIASILKYDFEIPEKIEKVEKGYYSTEKEIINETKKRTLKDKPDKENKYKSIECQIMDIADDIAYSVYDLEDAFKGKFIQPLDFVSADDKILEKIINKINSKHFGFSDFWDIYDVKALLEEIFRNSYVNFVGAESFNNEYDDDNLAIKYKVSKKIANNGYSRSDFTSGLISSFIQDIDIFLDYSEPSQSKVFFKEYAIEDPLYLERTYMGKSKSFLFIEVLKHFNYEFQIDSPKLRIIETRGREIVKTIFEALVKSDGKFLPNDVRKMYELVNDSKIYSDNEKESIKMRIICDFVACMTDHYALEFYGRLKSESAKSIFKPM